MGRGRAKAKQTKVARQLKYSSGGTDLSRLQQELAGEHGSAPLGVADGDSEDEDEEDFAEYGEYAGDEDEDVAR